MSKAEIVNVSDEPYVDPNDKIDEEEEKQETEKKDEIPNKKNEENQSKSKFKASSTIVPLEDKEEDENGFVQICAGTVGFEPPKPQTLDEESNQNNPENQNEIQKSACCLLI